MASVASPPRPVGAAPPPVRHGMCRLTLRIGGTEYRLRPIRHQPGFRKVWTLKQTRTRTAPSCTYSVAQPKGEPAGCTCPDHEQRCSICKHIMALAALGSSPCRRPHGRPRPAPGRSTPGMPGRLSPRPRPCRSRRAATWRRSSGRCPRVGSSAARARPPSLPPPRPRPPRRSPPASARLSPTTSAGSTARPRRIPPSPPAPVAARNSSPRPRTTIARHACGKGVPCESHLQQRERGAARRPAHSRTADRSRGRRLRHRRHPRRSVHRVPSPRPGAARPVRRRRHRRRGARPPGHPRARPPGHPRTALQQLKGRSPLRPDAGIVPATGPSGFVPLGGSRQGIPARQNGRLPAGREESLLMTNAERQDAAGRRRARPQPRGGSRPRPIASSARPSTGSPTEPSTDPTAGSSSPVPRRSAARPTSGITRT